MSSDLVDTLRLVLGSRPGWLVGGAVRDRLLGRQVTDFDVVVADEPENYARSLGKETRGFVFSVSDRFGTWRVIDRQRAWQVDVVALHGADITEDLGRRDFTVNAIAEALDEGKIVDPHNGSRDIEQQQLRLVSEDALLADPLRTLRGVRFATELEFTVEADTLTAISKHASQLACVAPERVFAELKRIVCADQFRRGLSLMDKTELAQVVFPELLALKGLQQNRFHHLDAYDHTIEVLGKIAVIESGTDLSANARELLNQPLADELTRFQALRFAALLHDVAKRRTANTRADGSPTFIGHDELGAKMAHDILRRWRVSEKLADYVATITKHHLRPGFLVKELPISRRTLWRYLSATKPYSLDVAAFSLADRLATRGENAEPAIESHRRVVAELAQAAVEFETSGAPTPLIRGDELAHELGIERGPELGKLIAQLREDQFVGEIATREAAISRARALLNF